MKITTKSGFKFDFDERMVNDWRVVKAIARSENKDDHGEMVAGTADLVSLIFGADEKRLIDHIMKKNDGYAPVEALREELFDVFNKVNAAKKSQSSQA